MVDNFTDTAFWNERYLDRNYAYGEKPNNFLRKHLSLFNSGDDILSLAEGEGRNGVYLACHGINVHAVDFSYAARDKARELAEKHNVLFPYEIADLSQFDLGIDKWNGIVSIFCHLPETLRPHLYQSIRSALKVGGLFLLEAFNPGQLEFDTGGPQDISHLVPLSELMTAFQEFQLIVAQEIERPVHEGQYHNGLSSVTQFIVRKR